jgi:hypothetical protein
MRRSRAFLTVIIVTVVGCTRAFGVEYDIMSQSSWLEFPDLHPADVLVFRKYSLFQNTLRNAVSIHCRKDFYPYLVFTLPPEIKTLSSLKPNDQDAAVPVRVVVNGTDTFNMTSEYARGEFFIDRDDKHMEEFDRMAQASALTLEIYNGKDTLRYAFLASTDELIDYMIKESKAEQKLRLHSPIDYGPLLRKCAEFKTL